MRSTKSLRLATYALSGLLVALPLVTFAEAASAAKSPYPCSGSHGGMTRRLTADAIALARGATSL